jgi:AcrR family transcriptional regulator
MSKTRPQTPEKPKRRRRTPESAQREILDAAGRQLMKAGPEGLRLQAIAADLGISHSSILHHFGSRDGLLDALSADAFAGLERDLKQSFAQPSTGDPAIDLFDKIARILGERGYARLLAWQLMSGRGPSESVAAEPTRGTGQSTESDESESGGLLDRLAPTVHARRLEHAHDQGMAPPEIDETKRLLAFTACAVFGEAFAGELMLRAAGLPHDTGGRRQFRHWVAKAIEAQVFPSEPPR